jgi:hypothetical protein
MQQQQQPLYDPRYEQYEGGPESAQRLNQPSMREASSRNAEGIKLNKNSGGSDEALKNKNEEYGYGEEYGYEYG